MAQTRSVIMAVAMVLLVAVPAPGQSAVNLRTYVLGPGDVLEVLVERNEGLTRTATIRADGTITLPLVGVVPAGGLTVELLQTRLTGLFARYIKNPRVVVSIVQFRPLRVAVVGQVATPGAIDFRAGATVLDALASAGGLLPTAAGGQAYIIRDGRQVIPVDLDAVLKGTGLGNVALQDRDIVVVPVAANILVVGEGITKQGSIPARSGMTLLEVLLQSGGVTERVSLREARLIRNRNQIVPVDWEALLLKADVTQDVPLQGGDIVLVPDDPAKEIQVFVMGFVRNPGAYPFRTVRTAYQALLAAGGPADRASLKDAHIIRRARPGGSGGGLIKIDLAPAFLRGDMSKDVPLQAGDVLYIPEQPFFAIGNFLLSILAILSGLGLR